MNGGMLVWCRKCSGYAILRLGAKLSSQCQPAADPKEGNIMINIMRKIDEGKVQAVEVGDFKVKKSESHENQWAEPLYSVTFFHTCVHLMLTHQHMLTAVPC